MKAIQEPKACLACGKPIKGRADKKYCDEFCRNSYNNDLKLKGNSSNDYMRTINSALQTNRRILKEMLDAVMPEEKLTLAKARLTQAGFNFKYITHTYINKKENIYFFCYDHGYMHIENDRCLIVRRREEKKKEIAE